MPADFERKLRGGSLLTAEILYHRPDCPALLQTFSFQAIDEAPRFPRLASFLDHWRENVKATIHSIRVAHSDWVGPSGFASVNACLRLH